jgi:hypothetical protein
MNMENDEQGPIENLLDGLDEHSDSLSSDELKAELLDRGIDLDAGLEKADATIAAYDKQDRLRWMKVADEKRKSLSVAEPPETSWVGRKAEEIKAAFEAFIKSAEKETAFAFRNKGDLSVEDMAQILDSNESLKQKAERPRKSEA